MCSATTCSRCFVGHCQTAPPAVASTASPTGLPKSSAKRASQGYPENGQRLAANADNPLGGHSIPQSAHVYLQGANGPTDIFGVPRSGGAHARFDGFTGGEQYVGINCKDNASPWQARRNGRNLEGERSQYARLSQLRRGQRR